MPGLVDLLAPHVDPPLIDITELKGCYCMQVSMDLPPPPPPLSEGSFKAIERAGLKLKKTHGPRRHPSTTVS